MHHKTAFVEIIKENEGLIYKVTKVYTNNKEDGQDLYQEIVYQLWKSFSSFRNEAKISTWMYSVALNTAITYLNKASTKKVHIPINGVIVNTQNKDDAFNEERIENLYTVIGKLNTIEKGLVLLYLEGKTYDEIANITGFTVTNVGTRLGRIKQKLKNQINK